MFFFITIYYLSAGKSISQISNAQELVVAKPLQIVFP